MSTTATITIGQKLKQLTPGERTTVAKTPPAGSLEARHSGVVKFVWRYTSNGKNYPVAIGVWDVAAPPKSLEPTKKGYSIAAAIRAAEDMAHIHVTHPGGYRCYLAELAAAAENKAAELARQDAERRAAEKFTLAALLAAYVAYLIAENRVRWREVQTCFRLHVLGAAPALASKKARDISSDDILNLMRGLEVAGKKRASNLLRSYLHAAFSLATRKRRLASTPAIFGEFGLTHNPVADTACDTRFNRSAKNRLSVRDMRIYYAQCCSTTGFVGAILRLNLLVGAQRGAQLVRLKTADVFADKIMLFDGKGRRTQPRQHYLPLTLAAAAALTECRTVGDDGDFALRTKGVAHVHESTLSDWSVEVGQAAGLTDFKPKRLRSGVESLLAEGGYGNDVRGQLQSHGLSGVQNRHYNDANYLPLVRDALDYLYYKLTEVSVDRS